MKFKKIRIFTTGDKVPEGAIYLNSVAKERSQNTVTGEWEECFYVYHYFSTPLMADKPYS
jgi:hypothetical protein